MNRIVLGLACLLTGFFLFVASEPLTAQDAAKDDAKKAKQRAEPRGLLPDYYNDVIDGIQREKIYAIQKKYEVERKALEDQLAALDKKIDAEIDSLLRPDQAKRLQELRQEAMEKRKQRAAAENKDAPPAK